MKKKYLIAVLALTIILTVAMTGCFVKVSIADIYNAASYKPQTSGNRTLSLTVKNGDTVVYSNINGEITQIEGFEFDNLITADAGTGFAFQSSYFKDEKLNKGSTESTYTANIVDTQNFLGVSDATDATIKVVVDTKAKTLKSTTINYKVTKSDLTFDVEINVSVA